MSDSDDYPVNPERCVRWRCVGCWMDVVIAWDLPVVSSLAFRFQGWWMDL